MDPARLRRVLLRWFGQAKRDLPWRHSADAYAIWVSEMMLQQTTVGTVVPYFQRFMARFPTIAALAASEEDDVLALWSGLGYYSRARNLRIGAQSVMADYGGFFPRDPEEALGLRGVGRYTANAVTSMAYGAKVAVVDGNVRRVLSRLFAERMMSDERAQTLATHLLSRRSPGTWNEAVMEFGATVCVPRHPRCPLCPVRAVCAGKDKPEYWSQGKPRRPAISTLVEMALVRRKNEVLLARNPPGAIMGGLLDLPHAGLPSRAPSGKTLTARYGRTLLSESAAIASIKHAVTHHRIEARIHRAQLRGEALPPDTAFFAVRSLAGLPLSAMTRKALRAAEVLPPRTVPAALPTGRTPLSRNTRLPSAHRGR